MLIQLVIVAYREHGEVEDIYPVPSPCCRPSSILEIDGITAADL